MFGKPTPKGWFEVEVRPNYNNPRKLKKILDGIFKPNEYRIQAQISEINKPRDEAIATPKASSKNRLRTFANMLSGMGIARYSAKRGAKAKEANASEELKDQNKAKDAVNKTDTGN
ncbi:hypothetical protein MFIFM68171_01473 [Madurella fahalii]|uniref:Uncharacterized protein n=1 Tax=Madurella fahalii TaxID=1157608 RepID=A0ABQ0G0I8_9PEZI